MLPSAFAVPPVARVVFAPEPITYRTHHAPERAVVFPQCMRCSRCPLDIGIYVFLRLKLLILGGKMCPQYSGIVLGTQPLFTLVVGYGLHVAGKLGEWFQIAVSVEHLTCYVLLHTVHLKSTPYLIVATYLSGKFSRRVEVSLYEALAYGGVNMPQSLSEQSSVELRERIIAFFVDADQSVCYHLRTESDAMRCASVCQRTTVARLAVVEVVD